MKKRLRKAVSVSRRRRFRVPQAAGVVLISLGVLLLSSLLSHSHDDPPGGATASGEVHNWIGLVGAYASRLMLASVGYAAYLLVLAVFLLGSNRLFLRPIRPTIVSIRTILVFSAIYCATTGIPSAGEGARAALLGGWVGSFASGKLLVPLLGKFGSYVFLVILLALYVHLATEIASAKTLRRARALWAWILNVLFRPGNWFEGKAIDWLRDLWAALARTPGDETPADVDGEWFPDAQVNPALAIDQGPVSPIPGYAVPDLDLLQESGQEIVQEPTAAAARQALVQTLGSFEFSATITDVRLGPVVTTYELRLARGTRVGSLEKLSGDLAMALKKPHVRIHAPVPGKSVVGIEVPNGSPGMVLLREVLESGAFRDADRDLTVALGVSTTGEPHCVNLREMPHLLVAGATGSGKSVCCHALVASILLRSQPHEVKLLLVDPKRVELSAYEGLPHLIAPPVTDVKLAAEALGWAVGEMERRFTVLQQRRVRDIQEYNRKIGAADSEGDRQLPYIVVLIDELADLMLAARDKVDEYLTRLAQKSRAVGIHLVLATQRPSVKVITGTIKANIPARIAFRVTSQTDSRVILDRNGAEKLLGRGDMLFLAPGKEISRIHGAFISADETERLVASIVSQKGSP